MLRIYNYMASGLALTGIVAYGFSQYLFANPALARSPVMFLIMLAPLGLVMWLSFGIKPDAGEHGTGAVLDLCRGDGLSLASVFPGLYRREHRAGVLHHRRDLRGDELLRLHDPARPVAIRLVS